MPRTRNGSGASGSFAAASPISAKALAGIGRRLREACAILVMPSDNSVAGWSLQKVAARAGCDCANASTAAFLTTCTASRPVAQTTTIVLNINQAPNDRASAVGFGAAHFLDALAFWNHQDL